MSRDPSNQADRADKYDLYQRSVQEPEVEVKFFRRVFRRMFGREPEVLREDFCGTAAVCCEWVKRRRRGRAMGVDLDPEPVDWCERNNLTRLTPAARERVKLCVDDVRKVRGPKADVVAAQNFSFFGFQTRPALRQYFRAARRNLAAEGLFVLDMLGGPELQTEGEEEVTRKDHFDYVWDQLRFDPISHYTAFAIHFRFPDGSEMHRAFAYEWRLWTLPEVRETLLEAGFSRVDVYWEGTDRSTGEGDGVFRLRRSAEPDPSWVAYLVAVA